MAKHINQRRTLNKIMSLNQQINQLRAANAKLRKALGDCMSYVDVDNLTMQTKHHNWQAVLDGKPWNPSNVDIEP